MGHAMSALRLASHEGHVHVDDLAGNKVLVSHGLTMERKSLDVPEGGVSEVLFDDDGQGCLITLGADRTVANVLCFDEIFTLRVFEDAAGSYHVAPRDSDAEDY